MRSFPKRKSAPRPGRPAAVVLATLATLGLAACSDDSPVQLEVLAPSVERVDEPQFNFGPVNRKPVLRVDRVEFGSLHDGVAVAAFGEAPAPQWFAARLQPRGDGLPAPDGFLEFDFVAAPPELNGAEAPPLGNPAQRQIRADRGLTREDMSGAVGVRVFAIAGVVAARF